MKTSCVITASFLIAAVITVVCGGPLEGSVRSRQAEYIRELNCLLKGRLASECKMIEPGEYARNARYSESEGSMPSDRIGDLRKRRPGDDDGFYSGW